MVRHSFLTWSLFSFFNMILINRNSFLCCTAHGKARKGQMLMQMLLLQQNKLNGHQDCLSAKLTHWPLGITVGRKEDKVEGSEGEERKRQ